MTCSPARSTFSFSVRLLKSRCASRGKRDPKKGKNGYSVHRPEEEHIALPEGIIPRIIDPDVFAVVQEKLASNKEDAARNNKWPKDVLLRAGHVRCGICQARLRVKNIHSHNKCTRVNRYMCDKQVGVAKHSVNSGAKLLDEAAWQFAMQYIIDPSLIRTKIEVLRAQAKVHIDSEAVERIIAGIKKKLRNLYTLAQDATDDETLDSLKALMHDLERQKHEAEAMLYEVAEEEETMQEVNGAIDRFEEWATNVRRDFVDPEYVSTYEEKRLAIKILGVQATVWPFDGTQHYEFTLAPPLIVSLLSG